MFLYSLMKPCATIVLIVLCTIQVIESLRCAQLRGFTHSLSNPSNFFNFSSFKYEHNTVSNQRCFVQLTINYNNRVGGGMFVDSSTVSTTGIFSTDHIEEWFNGDNESPVAYDALYIITRITLHSDTKLVRLIYQCSMNDYCDIDFVHEVFSTPLDTSHLDSIQKQLSSRLYSKGKNIPVTCFNETQCPVSAPFCSRNYSRTNRNGEPKYREKHNGTCISETQLQATLKWYQVYTKSNNHQQINSLSYDCNIPDCGSNQTSSEIIRMLTNQYRLPYNNSIIPVVRPTSISSTSTTSSTTIFTTTHSSTTESSSDTTKYQTDTSSLITNSTAETSSTTSSETTRATTTRSTTKQRPCPPCRGYATNISAHLYFTVLCFLMAIFF